MPQSDPVPPFADLMARCSSSAVHLELRDAYAVSNEDQDYQEWKAGHTYDLDDPAPWWNAFHQTVADAVARGVVVRRARVVSVPVTEYIRYEHSRTPQNLAAGEQVRWLPRADALDLLLPGGDLWLFDGRMIRWGLFDGDGALVGHRLDDREPVAKQVADAFEAVWERAVPHDQFPV